MLAAIEDRFGVDLPPEGFVGDSSLREILDDLRELLAEAGDTAS